MDAEQKTQPIGQWHIRDLVDRFPETMPILSQFGIDLCCGGGRELDEALTLHNAPVQQTLAQIENVVATAASGLDQQR